METLGNLFSSLDKKILLKVILLILWFFVMTLLWRIEKILDAHISHADHKFEQLNTRLFDHINKIAHFLLKLFEKLLTGKKQPKKELSSKSD